MDTDLLVNQSFVENTFLYSEFKYSQKDIFAAIKGDLVKQQIACESGDFNSELKLLSKICMANDTLSIIYRNHEDLGKSYSLLMEAYQINNKKKAYVNMASNLTNIGYLFLDEEDFAKSLEYFTLPQLPD